jgi:hypothetical protein
MGRKASSGRRNSIARTQSKRKQSHIQELEVDKIMHVTKWLKMQLERQTGPQRAS